VSQALYGMLGALGGALFTGTIAYFGPIQMQRRAFAEQREQAAAARRDSETATLRASGRADREAETTRIVLMRTTTRTWRDLLARTVQDLELGLLVEIAPFDEALDVARGGAKSALDHALHDGIWIHHSAYGYPALPAAGQGDSGEQLRVLEALDRVTQLTRAAVIRREPVDEEQLARLRQALDAADEARSALSARLLNRLEQLMGVTVIGGRASSPALLDGGPPDQPAAGG
jgi:hypothetical protein